MDEKDYKALGFKSPNEPESEESFKKQLQRLLNRVSMENGCNTPDFILATYLDDCLATFERAVNSRERWYGRKMGDEGPQED